MMDEERFLLQVFLAGIVAPGRFEIDFRTLAVEGIIPITLGADSYLGFPFQVKS